MPWGYGKANGPDHWHEDFPVAKAGCRQSPIDIHTVEAKSDEEHITKLEWTYAPGNVVDIENTGASWKANVNSEGSSLKGGPLEDEYALWQFHAHWGNDDTKGSEHTIDGRRYAAELHLVHWNKTKYSTPEEAASKGDGLAVLGMLMKEHEDEEHSELNKVINMLPSIRFKGDKVSFPEPVDPVNLLPKKSREFWTYPGSLTTPPLLESVTWIVFKEPIDVSKDQLKAMRQLLTIPETEAKKDHLDDEDFMVNNFRPPVPIGDRQLRQL